MPRRESSGETLRPIGLAWLAYWPFGCVAGFFLAQGDEFTRFHVRQGATVTTLWLAVLLIGFLSKGLAVLSALVLGACTIAGMIAALQGRCPPGRIEGRRIALIPFLKTAGRPIPSRSPRAARPSAESRLL